VSRVVASSVTARDKQLFTCFVDLTKAYDRVDRGLLWKVLRRRGVPEKILRVNQQLHEGAMAKVRVDGELSGEFELCRGLKQGSAIAALLFNIYLGVVVEAVQQEARRYPWHGGASEGAQV
jgi:hypothetical protein